MFSILMLTFNAPKYVKESIETVKALTKNVDYELIVVDNASNEETRILLQQLYNDNKIDKLFFNPVNSFFAGGNNIASKMANPSSDYYLLLNSDICVKNETWLSDLLSLHIKEQCGITSYGAVLSEPIRADGYCMLIDKSLYDKYLLDENFAWFWGITKLQSQVITEKKIIAIQNHENYIHHYGGSSGDAFKKAKGMDTDISEIIGWFRGKNKITVYKSIDASRVSNYIYNMIARTKYLMKIYNKLAN